MTFTRRRPLRLVTPNYSEDHRLKTSWFQPTNDTMKEQEVLLSNMFFLVRQGDEFGERLKCTRCQRRHDYITLMCVEKPVNGLANGLYAYYRALQDSYIEGQLRPEALARLEAVQEVLLQIPDLGSVHPQYAAKLIKDVGPSDLTLGAISLGILEGISGTEAKKLADKINERGIRPRFELGAVTQTEIDRALQYRGLKFTRSRW